MKINKRSGDFRGIGRCKKRLEYENALGLENVKNKYYDNAVIAKEILKGYFEGKFQIQEFDDFVSEGIEDDFETEETGNRRKQQLVQCLRRAAISETRIPELYHKTKYFDILNFHISVKPDVVFRTEKTIELVLYRAGKPNVTMKGRKRDGCVEQCIELYLLLLYGRTLLEPGEHKTIKASYYFLRKDTDSKMGIMDTDFFSENGKNIVYLEEYYVGGCYEETKYDALFLKQINEYEKGTECTEEDCKGCQYNQLCYFQKTPETFEKKKETKKKGDFSPSADQEKIISFRNGICRVVASAGSGKTESVTERAVRMISEGTDPDKILFITFTDAGAREMRERILRKCRERKMDVKESQINAMTFNRFAYRIVKAEYEDCGFTREPLLIDEVRASVIISQLLDEHNIFGLDYLNFTMDMPNVRGALSCARKVFSVIKSKNLDSDASDCADIVNTALIESGHARFYSGNAICELVDLYKEYSKRLKEDNLLEFSDQEPLMNHVLGIHPGYLERFGYEHIVVDEFQDSNAVQMQTIKMLTECSSFKSLMVVGDPRQSIFGFRDTSPENLLKFFEEMGFDGTDIILKHNRRSTPEIVNLANRMELLNYDEEKDLVSVIKSQPVSVRERGMDPVVKGFHKKDAEYSFIADEIEKKVSEGTPPESIAFIASKRTELLGMALALTERGIPWIMKNPMKLLDNSRVKGIISLAEAFYQPDADILYFNYLTAKYDGEMMNCLSYDEVKEMVNLLKNQFAHMDKHEFDEQRAIFHRYADDITGTDEVYAHFLSLVYSNEDLPSELEYIHNFLRFGASVGFKMEQDYAGVVLTTAHSSKGLEWPVCFVSVSEFDTKSLHKGSADSEALKEKRRLLFVAMTRARDQLYVTGRYVAYGSKDDREYNQFLREVFDQAGITEEYIPVEVKDTDREKKKTKIA